MLTIGFAVSPAGAAATFSRDIGGAFGPAPLSPVTLPWLEQFPEPALLTSPGRRALAMHRLHLLVAGVDAQRLVNCPDQA